MAEEPKSKVQKKKFKLNKKLIIRIVIVFLALAACAGVGIAVRLVQDSSNNNKAPVDVITETLPTEVGKSQSLAARGKYDEAQKVLNDKINSTTDSEAKFSLYLQQGSNYINHKQYDQAIESFKKAEAISQTYSLYFVIAVAYKEKGDNVSALTYFKKAQTYLDSNDPSYETSKREVESAIKEIEG